MSTSPLNSARVLIVEDEAVTRTALTVLLEHQGAIVVAVGSIGEGIRAIETGVQPDLLISNIRLPDGNGGRVLQAIRDREARLTAQTPAGKSAVVKAIALTGEALDLIRRDPESAGFQVYLSKPYNSRLLLDTIARLLKE